MRSALWILISFFCVQSIAQNIVPHLPSPSLSPRLLSQNDEQQKSVNPAKEEKKQVIIRKSPQKSSNNLAKLEEPAMVLEHTEKKIKRGVVRINDCLLISTIYTGNWNIECMRSGSTDPDSWEQSWHPTPISKKIIPKDLWPVCTWLNAFGYEQLISTPDIDIDPRLGEISRTDNVYLYRHGYDVSGGASLITRLGQYCPEYGRNVHPPQKKEKDWIDYIPL